MKKDYEKPIVEYQGFSLTENIMGDAEGDLGGLSGDTGVEEW